MTPDTLSQIVAEFARTVEDPRLVRFVYDRSVPGGVRALDVEDDGKPGIWRLYRTPVVGHDYTLGWWGDQEPAADGVVMDRVTLETAAVFTCESNAPQLQSVIDYYHRAIFRPYPGLLDDWLDWCAPDHVQGFEGRFVCLDADLAAQAARYAETWTRAMSRRGREENDTTGDPEPIMLAASAAWLAHKLTQRRRGVTPELGRLIGGV